MNHQPEDTDFSAELAEIIEFNLMGIETIKGKPWKEYAAEMLNKYHRNCMMPIVEYRPLWRVLYESYCKMDKSFSPNIVFMQLIKSFKDKIDDDFPVDEIDKDVFMDYLAKEVEKAMECE
jgi:hypothetical protein